MHSSLEHAAAPATVLSELAFQRLYDANATSIHSYLLHSKTAARLDALELRRYLFRIATNLLRDRWRSGDTTPFPDPPELATNPFLENSIDIRAMLHHLKPRERELLWLAYVEGMDHAEISAATGLNRLSVRTLLFRARNKAKQFLAPARPSL